MVMHVCKVRFLKAISRCHYLGQAKVQRKACVYTPITDRSDYGMAQCICQYLCGSDKNSTCNAIIIIKLGTHVLSDEREKPIVFQGHKSVKVKLTCTWVIL